VAHRTVYADDAAGQAGALLAAGRLSEAADAVRACADPRCSLVLGRALFGLKRLPEAAQALSAARSGVLAPYAAVLQGEALLRPEHPAAESARGLERELRVALPDPDGHELLLRAGKLLAAGQPAAAAAQAAAAADMVRGADRAEAQLLRARALAADGKRGDATPFLEQAWAHGAAHVAAQAGMLLARDRARHGRDGEAVQLADAVARKFRDAPEAEE